MKSDLIIFKSRVQNSIPEEDIELHNTTYQIKINIKRISFLIELNEKSYLKAYIDSISIESQEEKNNHSLKLNNFGLKFVKTSLSNDV